MDNIGLGTYRDIYFIYVEYQGNVYPAYFREWFRQHTPLMERKNIITSFAHYTIENETEKAYYMHNLKTNAYFWIPKSQMVLIGGEMKEKVERIIRNITLARSRNDTASLAKFLDQLIIMGRNNFL